MASSLITLFTLTFLTLIFPNQGTPELILVEEGYTVKTVINGHNLKINPYTINPISGSSDFIVLDSSSSTFYTVSFPISQEDEIVVQPLSGGGETGYSDGESGSARFKNPRSFAVDLRGNVYVADKANYVIRKISKLGVTTIAGGSSRKVGKEDGPAQNATFSSDFELVFVPKLCALLISDHGNQLVRQIDLKPEDCASGSQSGLGAVYFWALGLGLSCLFGFVIGMAIRPFVIRHEYSSPHWFSETWKHYLINLVRAAPMFCFAIRSEAARSTFYSLLSRLFWMSLHHLSLMFRVITVGSHVPNKDFVSLIDTDVNSREVDKPQVLTDQLKDLMRLSDLMQLSSSENELLNQEKEIQPGNDALERSHGNIDDMIQANFMGFAKGAKETSLDRSLVGITGLVKRK